MSSRHCASGVEPAFATISLRCAGPVLSGEARYQKETSPTPVSMEGVWMNGACSSKTLPWGVCEASPSFSTAERKVEAAAVAPSNLSFRRWSASRGGIARCATSGGKVETSAL